MRNRRGKENFIDPVFFYRILKLLSTPIRESKAYRLGIINEKGKQIKIPRSEEEKDSFSLLNRLVFRLQALISRYSSGTNIDSELRKIATSTYLIKECIEGDVEPLNLEIIFRKAIDVISEEDLAEFKEFMKENLVPYSVYAEEVAANNSMATGGIERPETKLMGSKKKKEKKKIKTRGIVDGDSVV